MVKAVIFDMDGVIFDTERLGLRGWINAGKEINYNIDPEFVSHLRGRNTNAAFEYFHKIFGEKVDFYDVRSRKLKYVYDVIEKEGIPIKKGFLNLINYLKEKNIKTALGTSSNEDTVSFYFEKAKFNNIFDFKIYGSQVTKGKPDPEIYIKACDGLGVRPCDAIIVEDSPAGICAGYDAGCKVIGVPDITPLDSNTLKKVNYICSDLDVVCDVLQYL